MFKEKELIHYNIFTSHKDLVAFTTTKHSVKAENTRFTGDSEELFVRNREELSSLLNINVNQLVFPRQTHTNHVVDIMEVPKKEIKCTDALVTNKRGICLCVQTADCVPMLLFDPVENVISAVHAGWRGTVSCIAKIAVRRMTENYNCFPDNIVVAIGPSISTEFYEVGEEVAWEVKKSIPDFSKTLIKKETGKFLFNLWEANRRLLLSAGVNPGNIEVLGECSYGNINRYYSARRDGIQTGRMVSGIMLKY